MKLWGALRAVLGLSSLDEAALLQVARRECDARGWPWVEPIAINQGFWLVRIRTNCNSRGGNANIWLGVRDGRISRARFAPF